MINTIFYYLFCCSVIFFYGVGLNKSIELSYNYTFSPLKFTKMLLIVVATSVLTYFLTTRYLVPNGLDELCPIIIIILYSLISIIVEGFIRLKSDKNSNEFIATFLFTLITVTESFSYLDCILIALSCVLAYIIFIPVLSLIIHHMDLNREKDEFKRILYIMLSIVILMIIMLFTNTTWLNKGVFQ